MPGPASGSRVPTPAGTAGGGGDGNSPDASGKEGAVLFHCPECTRQVRVLLPLSLPGGGWGSSELAGPDRSAGRSRRTGMRRI